MGKQKDYGDKVAYVKGGARYNAIVLQSQIVVLEGNEEEHLILTYPDPAQNARVMTSTQLEHAMVREFGVRPFDKVKTPDGVGVGWADVDDEQSDAEVLKDGQMLKDLVHQINETNPVDAMGHDLKENEKFQAAAKRAGVDITPYDKRDNHQQIVHELQHQGIKPNTVGEPMSSGQPVAAPEIATSEASEGDEDAPNQEQANREREAMQGEAKQAPPEKQENLSDEDKEAQNRGELYATDLNTKPEDNPEFGTHETYNGE